MSLEKTPLYNYRIYQQDGEKQERKKDLTMRKPARAKSVTALVLFFLFNAKVQPFSKEQNEEE